PPPSALCGGLGRLPGVPAREQLVARAGGREAAPPPRRARGAPDRQPAAVAHERARAPVPLRELRPAALEAEDRKAPVAVPARAQVRAPEAVPQPPAALRQRERGARLLLIGQAHHLGQRVLLGERAQRLRPRA